MDQCSNIYDYNLDVIWIGVVRWQTTQNTQDSFASIWYNAKKCRTVLTTYLPHKIIVERCILRNTFAPLKITYRTANRIRLCISLDRRTRIVGTMNYAIQTRFGATLFLVVSIHAHTKNTPARQSWTVKKKRRRENHMRKNCASVVCSLCDLEYGLYNIYANDRGCGIRRQRYSRDSK